MQPIVYHTRTILVLLLILLTRCGGNEALPQEFTTPQTNPELTGFCEECEVEVFTKFILENQSIVEEPKKFLITPENIVVDLDTVHISQGDIFSLGDGAMGYRINHFPRKVVEVYKVKVDTTNKIIYLGNTMYSAVIPTTSRRVTKSHVVRPGETRKVLQALGIPSEAIPKIPKVGQIINY